MNNEQILEFIEDYRSYQCLWDIHSKFYANINKRNDAYRELSEKYNINEKAVKNKIKSLRSYFSKEHQKVTEMKSGSGSDSKYDSTWFAYRQLLFIADSVTPRQTKDSIVGLTISRRVSKLFQDILVKFLNKILSFPSKSFKIWKLRVLKYSFIQIDRFNFLRLLTCFSTKYAALIPPSKIASV
nr:unnamed protein product [Callosobruchus chinensis]